MTTPLPTGIRLRPDRSTLEIDDRLVGGSPRRMMRLSRAGCAAWQELMSGPIRTAAGAALGRRLTDAEFAHPLPGPATAQAGVTVVIPVRDRAPGLDRCLRSVHPRCDVVVVDDGSVDAGAVERVAGRHGARLVRRDRNGGPAAARNAGLSDVTSPFVAFLDSDCVASDGWIERLSGHFADPLVAAVAPRIQPAGAKAASYLATCGVLDLGDAPALVRPGGRVSYVPTAALVVRRSALAAIATRDDVFDPELRYGEDVDLVWRLVGAGWRVRYEPAVVVTHREEGGWRERAVRRFAYGTSAAPLSQRHPEALAPIVVLPLPACVVLAGFLRRPRLALLATIACAGSTSRILARAGLTELGTGRTTLRAISATWLSFSRYAAQFSMPAVLAVVATPGRSASRSPWLRRIAGVSVLVGAPMVAWRASQPRCSWARFVSGRVVDECSYGAGVYWGCIRRRTFAPLVPRFRRPTRWI
ncbi:MAG TPA: mycofactocin biosynthesis glycosyltransferase MftF [Mycobacteriales bacterium]|nr:mycofactocin biosynthesis glycosyltransferase MftF [Mycobacteriales bacterium]